MKLVIGTYTQGIYQTHLTTNGLMPPTLLADTPQPTYLNYSRNGYLFSANQSGKVGGISVFKVDNNRLIPCDDCLSFAPAPVHLTVDDTHHMLFASNYNGGYTDIYNFTAAGKLRLLDSFLNVGQGPLPQQNTAHIHFTCLAPDGRLLVLDLGTDSLFTFNISHTGQLQDLVATYHFRPGLGTRHLRFDPAKHCVFVLGELSSTVAVLNYEPTTVTFHQTQLISTIPTDWNGQTGGGAIHLAHNGHYLYVSNRGHNSITVYRITGPSTKRQLIFMQNIASQGDFPRDFCLSPNDDHLIVANQKSNLLTSFSVDTVTGTLTPSHNSVPVPEPVCVKLIPD